MTDQPASGARFVYDLIADHGDRADYTARVLTPTAAFSYAAVLGPDGAVALTAVGAPAPAELVTALAMFAKLTARGADGRRAEGLVAWPPRVTRWRPA